MRISISCAYFSDGGCSCCKFGNFNSGFDPCDYSGTPIWGLISGYNAPRSGAGQSGGCRVFAGPPPTRDGKSKKGVSSGIKCTPCPVPSMLHLC